MGDARRVVDVACGNGPVGRRLAGRRVVGVDRSGAELRTGRQVAPETALVQAEALALPLAAGSADALTVSMALMLFESLEAFLAEAARVLVPDGILAATAPVRSSGGVFRELLSVMGQAGVVYPQPLPAASLPDRLAANRFRLTEDVEGSFARTVGTGEAEKVVRSFYRPGTGSEQVADAVAVLSGRAEQESVEVTYRLRRIVAVRLGQVRA